MSKLLGKALQAARKQKRYTQQEVADALGVSRVAVSQWENGTSDPSTDNLIRICDYLDLNLSAATAGMVKVKPMIPLDADKDDPQPVMFVRDRRPEFRDTDDEFIRYLDGNPVSPGRTRDVPVYASAFAGEEGDFYRTDEIIDFVRRPPSAGGGKSPGMYALYVPSTSLSPRYELGELMFLTGGRVAVPGDYIAVRLRHDDPVNQLWLLRRLVGRTKEVLSCQTLWPPEIFNIPMEKVHTIDRIMGWGELIDS